MAWEETEISIHRSHIDETVWAVNIPTADIAQIFESMGRLRAVQRWVVEEGAPKYGYDVGDRRRWVDDGPDVKVLEVWTG